MKIGKLSETMVLSEANCKQHIGSRLLAKPDETIEVALGQFLMILRLQHLIFYKPNKLTLRTVYAIKNYFGVNLFFYKIAWNIFYF